MVWFENVVTVDMLFENYLARLRNLSLEADAKTSVDDLLASMTTSKANADVMQASTMPNLEAPPAMTMSSSMHSLLTTSTATGTNAATTGGSRNMHVQG